MGDFNAHLPEYLPFRSNRIVKLMPQLQETLDINIINDGTPTFGFSQESPGSVLYLQMVSSDIFPICSSRTINERFGSDHCPVIMTIPIKLAMSCQSSARLVLRRVDWTEFNNRLSSSLPDLESQNSGPLEGYDHLVNVKVESLVAAGVYIPWSLLTDQALMVDGGM